MALLTRSELIERLEANIVEVNFTKVSGEPRKMRCTLCPDLLPPQKDIGGAIKANLFLLEESGRLNVWDVEANDWRSFLIESVTYVLNPAP